MEKKLFDFEGFDQQDLMAFTFYKCKLKVPIGPFKVGEIVHSIDIEYDKGELTCYDENVKEVFVQKMELSFVN